jgi:hypothetical protein
MPEEPKNIDMQDLITRTQAAELRGVTRAAIADLIKRKKLTVIEIAGRDFLSRREVESFEPDKGGRPAKAKDDKSSGSDGKIVVKKGTKR